MIRRSRRAGGLPRFLIGVEPYQQLPNLHSEAGLDLSAVGMTAGPAANHQRRPTAQPDGAFGGRALPRSQLAKRELRYFPHRRRTSRPASTAWPFPPKKKEQGGVTHPAPSVATNATALIYVIRTLFAADRNFLRIRGGREGHNFIRADEFQLSVGLHFDEESSQLATSLQRLRAGLDV